MDVSIIIVNYNTSKLLDDCISSLIENITEVLFEIIVVDNASIDDSVALMKRKYPSINLIESKINLGFGKANNLGVSFANGKYLFLLNTDTLMVNNAVKVFFDFMELKTSQDIGACGGNLFNLDLTPNFSYSLNYPSLKNIISYRSGLSFLENKESFNSSKTIKEVAIIIGADFFVRKKVFDLVRGFDPSFFMYVEDGDLCYRISKLKYKLVSVPEAKIIHLQGKSSSNFFKLHMEYSGYLIFFKKHYSFFTVKFYSFIEIFFAALRLIWFGITMKKSKVQDYFRLIKFILISK